MGNCACEKKLALRQWKFACVRGAVVACAQLTFYSAIGFIELATISALGHISDLFIVLLSILLFRERVGKWRCNVLFVGFMGAILIVQPGSDTFSPRVLFPIFAAFCCTLYLVTMHQFQ